MGAIFAWFFVWLLWISFFILGGVVAWFLPFIWWGLALNLIALIVLIWSFKKGQLAIAERGIFYDYLYLASSFTFILGYWTSFFIHWCVNHIQIV